jgi:hypothetical protein
MGPYVIACLAGLVACLAALHPRRAALCLFAAVLAAVIAAVYLSWG